jgi:hypothetical protein
MGRYERRLVSDVSRIGKMDAESSTHSSLPIRCSAGASERNRLDRRRRRRDGPTERPGDDSLVSAGRTLSAGSDGGATVDDHAPRNFRTVGTISRINTPSASRLR